MHEASLIQEVLDIAIARMREESAVRIHCVRLRIGALSGAVPEAMSFAFEALKQDTPAADANLEMEFVPLRLYCPLCNLEFAADDAVSLCPTCGSWKTEVRQGEELEILSLELSGEVAL